MEAAKEAAETPAKTSQEVMTSRAEKASAKETRGNEKAQKEIESRLEFLARMYATNKAGQTGEEEGEGEGEGEEGEGEVH
jgi:hypothetical protein